MPFYSPFAEGPSSLRATGKRPPTYIKTPGFDDQHSTESTLEDEVALAAAPSTAQAGAYEQPATFAATRPRRFRSEQADSIAAAAGELADELDSFQRWDQYHMNRTLQLAAGSTRSTTSGSGSSTHGRSSKVFTLPPNIKLVPGSSQQQAHEHERPARSRTLTLDTASLMTETQLGESWPQKRRQRQSQV